MSKNVQKEKIGSAKATNFELEIEDRGHRSRGSDGERGIKEKRGRDVDGVIGKLGFFRLMHVANSHLFQIPQILQRSNLRILFVLRRLHI